MILLTGNFRFFFSWIRIKLKNTCCLQIAHPCTNLFRNGQQSGSLGSLLFIWTFCIVNYAGENRSKCKTHITHQNWFAMCKFLRIRSNDGVVESLEVSSLSFSCYYNCFFFFTHPPNMLTIWMRAFDSVKSMNMCVWMRSYTVEFIPRFQLRMGYLVESDNQFESRAHKYTHTFKEFHHHHHHSVCT